MVIFFGALKNCRDVFRRDILLHGVGRRQDVTAGLIENGQDFFDFPFDFFHTALRQQFLGIDAAPESDFFAVTLF